MQTRIQMRLRYKRMADSTIALITDALQQDGATITDTRVSPGGKGVYMTIDREHGARGLADVFERFDDDLLDVSGRADDASFFMRDCRASRLA